MADSYSVKAILSATDRGFSSTMKRCMGTLDSLSSKISGFSFGILTGAGMAAFNTLKNGASSLISEIDSSNAAWKTFTGNMEMLGKGKKEIEGVKKELQDFAQKTVYSSSDMATTFAQLEAVGVKNTTKLVKGFGGLAAAAENPQQAMKTLSTQATQMAAKPTVAWADFKLMLEQTPAGIAAVAKHMGMSTATMVQKVQNGEIATDKFLEAIAEVGTNDSFSKLATEAKTMGQAMDGLKETVGNKLTPAFNALSQRGIKAINKLSDKLAGLNANKIAAKAVRAMNTVQKYFNTFMGVVKSLAPDFKAAFSAVSGAIKGVFGSFKGTKPIDRFKSVLNGAAGILRKVFQFVAANGDTFKKTLSTGVSIASKVWNAFKSAATKVGSKIADVAGYIISNSDAFMDIIAAGVAAAKPYWNAFVSVLSTAVGIIKKVAVFIVENKDAIVKLIPWLFGAVAAFKGFKAVKSVLPFVKGFSSSVASMVKNLGGGLIGKLKGLSKSQETVGQSAAKSSGNMLKSAQAYALMGVAVLLIATGFALLAQSAIALANAGGLAIGVMAGLVVGLAGIMVVMALVMKMLAPMAGQLMPVATAMLAMGAAVLLVSAGFTLLAHSSIALAAAGTPAILVMVGMVAAIALLAIGAAALAPALTAGAVGLIAFGAALVLCGVGAVLAATSLVILSTCLPTLAEYGLQGALAITALGGSMIVFAAGAALAGAASLVLGAGLLVVSASVLVLSVGVLALAAGMLLLAAGVAVTSAALMVIAGTMPMISVGTLAVTMAFATLLAMSVALTAALLLLNAPIVLITATSLAATLGTAAFGTALLVAAAGALVMAAGLLGVTSQMKSIAKNAKTAEKSLTSMQKSVKVVENSINALGSKVESAMQTIKNAFQKATTQAKTSGTDMGKGFASGLKAGLTQAAADTQANCAMIATVFTAAVKNATLAGKNIGKSIDAGIKSGMTTAVTNTKAKCRQIAQVFKTSVQNTRISGRNMGTGFVNGLRSGIEKSSTVATATVSKVNSRLNAGHGGAYSAGAYISQGFANGMLSQLGTIESAAARMAAAADAAIRAKAQIHSPSRLFRKEGQYTGEGYVLGVKDKVRDAAKMAKELVSIPRTAATPNFATSYGWELSGDYDYYRNNEYVIEIPVVMDGRETARVIAPYTQEELNRRQTRENRKNGKV